MTTNDQKYRFRKSCNGKLILQVKKESEDERKIIDWVDADDIDMRVAMYILNRD